MNSFSALSTKDEAISLTMSVRPHVVIRGLLKGGSCSLIRDSVTTICFNAVIFIKIKKGADTSEKSPPPSCGCPEENMTDKILMKKFIGRNGAYILSPTSLSVIHVLLAVNRKCESVCSYQCFLLRLILTLSLQLF